MELKLRCLQIDVARQKETVAYLKKLIDFAAAWNYNSILLYLENAVRTEETAFFDPNETYSEAEIREIVAYAEAKGLDVIPAMENLSHLEKFFKYEQFAQYAELDRNTRGRGFSGTVLGNVGCTSNPDFYRVFDRYITDVAKLFNSPYIHMGLDEANDFAVCDKCMARLQNGETRDSMFLEHILHTHDLCKRIGKRMMMWDDFLEYADVIEDLPRDIIFCNWNYGFVGEVPVGHWTNRIKKDWFRYYDRLGFDYIFCVWSHSSSSVYNVDSFTRYAEKYAPMGALMTTWEHAHNFYEGELPVIAYAGKRWSGQIHSREDGLAVYAQVLGSEELARTVYDATLPWIGCNMKLTELCENDDLRMFAIRKEHIRILEQMERALPGVREDAKDVAEDVYAYILEITLQARLNALADQIMDCYAAEEDPAVLLPELQRIRQAYERIKAIDDRLWEKNRTGIVSQDDAYEKKFQNIFAKLEDISGQLTKPQKYGVLSVEMLYPEMHHTARVRLTVRYQGEAETVLYEGGIKSGLTEQSGQFAFRFRTADKPIESLRFGVWGEGAYYPCYFRHVVKGKAYIPDTAERLTGICQHPELVLEDNYRFCAIGNDNGREHFRNLAKAQELHEMIVTFREL